MLDIYAQTFMTATRQRSCTPVRVKGRKWWQRGFSKCIDLSKL